MMLDWKFQILGIKTTVGHYIIIFPEILPDISETRFEFDIIMGKTLWRHGGGAQHNALFRTTSSKNWTWSRLKNAVII